MIVLIPIGKFIHSSLTISNASGHRHVTVATDHVIGQEIPVVLKQFRNTIEKQLQLNEMVKALDCKHGLVLRLGVHELMSHVTKDMLSAMPCCSAADLPLSSMVGLISMQSRLKFILPS